MQVTIATTVANSDAEGKGKTTALYFPRMIIMAEKNKTKALSPRQTLDGQRVLRIPGSAIRIATWNAQSMFKEAKFKNVIEEMTRLQIDILGISESRLKGTGIQSDEETITYYSGNDDKDHWNGVAIIIRKNLRSAVINFLPVSDRVMLLQIRAKPVNLNIVQIYAPTADKSDNILEEFYKDLKTALTKLKKT